MEFSSPSPKEFSSPLLEEESLSDSSRMTGVFFLEDALFRLLYLRYFAFLLLEYPDIHFPWTLTLRGKTVHYAR